MDEFELIRRYFARDAQASDVIVGIGDDGAVLELAPGIQQVQVIDTMVEGVHFPSDMAAADVGYRVVAVNLSDIAAMGAKPRWMTLALTLADQDESWVDQFAAGLFDAAREYDVELVGGDTTSGKVIVATVHMTGVVEEGAALLRSGANVGDTVFVTGTVGDAAAGLALLRDGEREEYLQRRFLRPRARVAKGRELIGQASAAIDLSDGLVGDLRKLLDASGVGADIDIECIPTSETLRQRFTAEEALEFALTGGDDYELLFTGPADIEIDDATPIGMVTAGTDLRCRLNGELVEVNDAGYRHFA
ncbi:MAG: thiamine-phosphate kinase [Gammaproteobacteria bacterium]|nr:thiamine-phosphate kinase [Gammaproteobacteria bacterium]